MSIFIFGAGFTSRAFLRQAELQALKAPIFGTTRSIENGPTLTHLGAQPIVFDGVSLSADLLEKLQTCKNLIISIAPGTMDPVLNLFENFETKSHGQNALLKNIRVLMPNLEWIGYLSTVGVYGNHDGDWVDEDTICKPVSQRSHNRLNAEAQWIKLGRQLNLPTAIFRLSGIYGKGRNTFINIQADRARRLIKPGQVFNRIVNDDIASALIKALDIMPDGIFNITDNEPAPPQDVVTYACELMGIEPPQEVDFFSAELTPMARSFYGENKRVVNSKAKSILGWKPCYPNYRIALDWLWQTGWKQEEI